MLQFGAYKLFRNTAIKRFVTSPQYTGGVLVQESCCSIGCGDMESIAMSGQILFLLQNMDKQHLGEVVEIDNEST
jgi:hypothetical protein